ncbi:Hypothetical_protein [Hexamita inflata]|uniref:Hypothetical_protein n=1 Tax=Hexamita inflata TaxID=28002 RepID=A0ABP1HLJ6_9EUKA
MFLKPAISLFTQLILACALLTLLFTAVIFGFKSLLTQFRSALKLAISVVNAVFTVVKSDLIGEEPVVTAVITLEALFKIFVSRYCLEVARLLVIKARLSLTLTVRVLMEFVRDVTFARMRLSSSVVFLARFESASEKLETSFVSKQFQLAAS